MPADSGKTKQKQCATPKQWFPNLASQGNHLIPSRSGAGFRESVFLRNSPNDSLELLRASAGSVSLRAIEPRAMCCFLGHHESPHFFSVRK